MNKKLARLATEIASQRDAHPVFVDLRDYPMPIYDGDLELSEGLPESARELKALFLESDGLFIASPEYNSSIPPLLKNALDWVSRKETPEEPPLQAYRGKVAALAAASPGDFGGLRALMPLRMMLANIGVHVIPDQLAVPNAFQAFDANGRLHESRLVQALASVLQALILTTGKLAVRRNA